MANVVLNQALSKMAYYASLPLSNDALVLVDLELTGLESDSVLRDKDTLADLVSGTTNEQTTVGRKTLAGVVATVDDTSNTFSVRADNVTYSSPGGNPVGAFVICYDPDTTSGTDADLIPLVKADGSWNPGDGVGFTLNLSGDFYRSSSVG
jgi:hypothetical protein